MASPQSRTGVVFEFNQPVNPSTGATAFAAAATNRVALFRSDRVLDFREIGITAQNTIVSGAPATNHLVAQLWNQTDATKIAQATITGTTSGTQLERLSYVSIATRAQFLGPGSSASANKMFELVIVGTQTLSKNLNSPVVTIITDVINDA